MNEESSRNDLWRPMCDPDWALVPDDQCTPVVPPPLPGVGQTPPATAATASSGSTDSGHHQRHAMEEGWWKKRYMQHLRRFLAYCARRHGNTHKPEGRTLSDCIRHSRGTLKIAPRTPYRVSLRVVSCRVVSCRVSCVSCRVSCVVCAKSVCVRGGEVRARWE
jgi:hypothetical protein